MGQSPDHGPTWYEDLERKARYELFDSFVDLALDGVITVEQAIEGYREKTIDEKEFTA